MGEKTGTMTNSERVVTLCPAFREPVGEAKADWEIFAEVGRRLGFADQFEFADSAAVRSELIELTRDRPCDMTGITHEQLRQQGPMQWPCPDRPTDMPRECLYTDLRFHTPDGRARFGAYHAKGLAEPSSPDYPFVLTTGRVYGHWHTMTRTGRIEKTLKMHPEPFIEIHPRDASKLLIEEGDWVEVRSRRGFARFPAKITKAISTGTVFVPMHWGTLWAQQSEANALTHPMACPESGQPELKACAVQLTRVVRDLTATDNLAAPSLIASDAIAHLSFAVGP